jgi:hypothetical protein
VLLTSTARTSFNKISARLRYPRANTICIHSLSPVVSVFGCAASAARRENMTVLMPISARRR